MVLIAVKNFRDDSLGTYELPEGSSIIDLKVEIEATEGIPLGHQRLVRGQYNTQDLNDNESLDSVISDYKISGSNLVFSRSEIFQDRSSITIIYLEKARLFYRSTRRQDTIECNKTSDRRRPVPLSFSVDLDIPVHAGIIGKILYPNHKIDPPILVVGSDGRPTFSISDLDQSFSHYGVCNGDTIHFTYALSDTPVHAVRSMPARLVTADTIHSVLEASRGGKGTIVRAKYDWNGEIMHPNIEGLSLKHTALFAVFERSGTLNFSWHESPGWLYGSPVSPSEVRLSRLFSRREEGYFPENFVSPVHRGETIEENIEVTSTGTLDIPPVPSFHFPPARGMTFRVPIGDKGHSFLKLTADYERVSSPVDPTHVTISLLCTTHDIRRVSAVSVFIRIPHSAPLDVKVCENDAQQKEIHTDKEVVETQSKGKYFGGINVGTHGTTVGLQVGTSRNHSLGDTEKGQKVSRRKVTARIDEDTIFWNLKAPTSKLDEDGLDGEESITLVLKKKPVLFEYKCRVTHARGGNEKTMERMSFGWLRFFY